jgi:hypothetical protein
MSEAQNLKLDVTNNNSQRSKDNGPQKWVRLEQVISWIDSLGYGDFMSAELKKIVSKYPEGTYYRFKDNINKHVTNIQKKGNNES